MLANDGAHFFLPIFTAAKDEKYFSASKWIQPNQPALTQNFDCANQTDPILPEFKPWVHLLTWNRVQRVFKKYIVGLNPNLTHLSTLSPKPGFNPTQKKGLDKKMDQVWPQ